MVDLLDWQALAAAGPKVLVGFSDVTALHQAFAARLGLSTLHGPVVSPLGRATTPRASTCAPLLFEPAPVLSLTPLPVTALVPGRAEGVLVGGNISLLPPGSAPRRAAGGRVDRGARGHRRGASTASTGC